MSTPVLQAERVPASPAPAGPSRRRWWPDLTAIGLIAAATVTILIIFRREPVYSDDLGYWNRWERIGASTSMANHYRLIMVASAQLSRVLFGDTMVAYHAVGIFYATGLVVMLYVLTRLLFPQPVAIGAAVMLASSHLFLEDASLLLPDWPAMFFLMAGLVCLVLAARRFDDTRRVTWAAIAAGFFFFLMAWAKEGAVPILLAVPICAFLIARAGRALRVSLISAGSTLAFALLELGLLWWLFGNPLRRLEIVLTGHVGRRTSERLGGRVEHASDDNGEGGGSLPGVLRGQELTWGDLAERYLDPLTGTFAGRWILALAVVALVVSIVSRSRKVAFFTVPAVIGTGFVVFGVGSIDPIVPILSMKFRYLSLGWVFMIPMIAAAVWLLARWIVDVVSRRRGTRRTRWIVASVIYMLVVATTATTGIAVAAERPVFVRVGEDGLRQTIQLIQQFEADGTPIDRILADGRTQLGLQIQAYEDGVDIVDRMSTAFETARPGDLVVVNRKRIARPSDPGRGGRVEEFVLFPPTNWRLIALTDIANFRVYYVEPEPPGMIAPPPLATEGTDVTGHMRSYLVDDTDDAHLAVQRDASGLLAYLENTRNTRFVLGPGSHMRAPRNEHAEALAITERGRLGVRLEMHRTPGVEIQAIWVRTYGPDEQEVRRSRMYQVDENDRRSTPGFAIDAEGMSSTSWVDSVDVDPNVETTFRVVGFAEGTGVITIDRVVFEILPAP